MSVAEVAWTVPAWFPDWRGHTCVIVASGPSAKDVPLELAKGRAKFIVVNSSWLLAPWADVLYACDFKWWDVHKGVPQFAGLKLTQDGRKFGKQYPDVKHIHCNHSTDALLMAKPGQIGWGGNSGFNAINLAAQFGVTKIVLVGFDMRMDKGLHWHGKHGDKLNNPTANNIVRWCKAVDDAAPALKKHGIAVFNVSPVSKLNAYPKVSLEEALVCDPSPKPNGANMI